MKNIKWFEVLDKLTAAQALPHRIILSGPPGTGKSCWAQYHLGEVERITLSKGAYRDDLIGSYSLVNGSTVWVDGPATRAMRHGRPLVVDEIDKISSECATMFHAICDDLNSCRLLLPNGEVVTPKEGFRIIGTTNESPEVIEEALLDRFDLILQCNEPHPEIVKTLPKGMQKMIVNHYSTLEPDTQFSRPLTMRRIINLSMFSSKLDLEFSALLVFGPERGKEIVSAINSANLKA